ncbi:Dehydrin COR47 [Bienertia sinuspersici]
MSDQYQNQTTESNATDRGLFDYFGKKEEKPKEEVTMAEPEKLQRSDSSSSSSSEEEVEEDGVKIKRKKKKGMKDKLKEKISGHKDEEAAVIPQSDYNNHDQQHQAVASENADEIHPEETKGFFEKIKEKFPGHQKDDAVAPAPAPAPAPPVTAECGANECCGGSDETQEKKGFLEKIKEKLPGGHKDADEAKKDY